jgi:serine protease inhibitor
MNGFFRGCAIITAVVICAGTTAFGQELPHTNPIVRGSNALGIELYTVFAEKKDNFVFSPSSVYTALAMLYGGAGGQTADQIRGMLHLPEDMTADQFHSSLLRLQSEIGTRANMGEVALGTANAIWPQSGYPILERFIELMAEYGATIEALDYGADSIAARETINAWASEKTNNRITNLLEDPPYPTTLLILANAVFFSGSWDAQFDPANTTLQPFFTEDGSNSNTPLMNLEQNLTYREFETVKIVELPYDEFQMSMVVALPTGENTLSDVEANLSSASLEEWTTHYWTAIVDLYLPKFSLESRFDLKPVLSDMGMTDVFANRLADLSGIDGIPQLLSLGFMLQKASIDVHEKGAVAAAATVAGGCFPAGTPVHTSAGTLSIEEVGAGMTVRGFDMSTKEWVDAQVVGLETIAYSGDVITFQAGDALLSATGNHPFFVTEGVELGTRPAAVDVPALERRWATSGRWVEARDLRDGDILKAKTHYNIAVSNTSRSDETLEVYNLQVERFHNYAVGTPGILVHNKGSGEPVYAEFRADRPFMFIIHDPMTGAILFMGRVGRL